ncbi:MAG: hypothetical protein COA66_02590 [Arcobacter sp.]|nr:MAG: hypothetical protein COA66_02590 [Arcobacter sp.]
MDEYVVITYLLMGKIGFSPLVLIGLLITSLSLILNLKDTNTYIRKFKEHKNIDKFINKIFHTALFLLFMFILWIITQYVGNSIFLSILYLMSLIIIVWNLFIIVYILKVIVETSLKDDR